MKAGIANGLNKKYAFQAEKYGYQPTATLRHKQQPSVVYVHKLLTKHQCIQNLQAPVNQ